MDEIVGLSIKLENECKVRTFDIMNREYGLFFRYQMFFAFNSSMTVAFGQFLLSQYRFILRYFISVKVLFIDVALLINRSRSSPD